MNEIKPLTKFCITHRRSDDPTNGYWAAYLWAGTYMEAWDKAKILEETIPVVYDITIEGVFLGEIDAGIEIPQEIESKVLASLVPWFVYTQLEEYIKTEDKHPDYDEMIRYFEVLEEFEICANLVEKKNSHNEIKL